MDIAGFLPGREGAGLELLHRTEKGPFGSGYYLHNSRFTKPDVLDDVERASYLANIENPLIVSGQESIADKLGINSLAAPLVSALYGSPSLTRSLIDEDGNIGEIVELTVRDAGYDAIMISFNENEFDLIVFDPDKVRPANKYQLPSGYEVSDFSIHLHSVAQQSAAHCLNLAKDESGARIDRITVQMDEVHPMRTGLLIRTDTKTGKALDEQQAPEGLHYDTLAQSFMDNQMHNELVIVSPRRVRVINSGEESSSTVKSNIDSMLSHKRDVIMAEDIGYTLPQVSSGAYASGPRR